jgi:serine/threonine protein kinase
MSPESTRQFFEIAGQQGMLPVETLRELQLEAASRELEGSSLVLQKGLLTPLDVEIIETLRQPSAAIPGYEIQSVIGRGGMGVVYRARQLALDRVVALKMVLVSHTANPTMLARFEQEAQTVARLLHPHIITAYDFGRHAGRLFFAMEYVEGEDAERYVNRLHPLTERQVWHLIRQAAAGLAHAAESGIVHRDIKPANLLLVSPPKGFPLPQGMPMVKIADFGLAFLSAEASERTRLTAEQSTLGSPHYMAPEQLNAGSPVDERVDIYSLGATAFHLFAGRAPYHGQTLPQIITQKLGDIPPSIGDARPDLSPETIRLLEQMLARDPNRRIGTYAELLDRIDALPAMGASGSNAAVTGTNAAMTTTTDFPSTPPRRTWHPWIDLALTVAVLIVAGVGFAIAPYFTRPAVAPPFNSTLKETGWSAELFDGNSLRGWKTQSGAWTVDVDDEGGRIISGTGGEILRPLLRPDGDRAVRLNYYRLTIAARLHESTAVELHFNVGKSGARDLLRLTFDRVALGHRAGARAAFEPRGEAHPFDVGADRLHEIRLERDLSQWRLFIDDAPAGSLAASDQADLPEFHLVAEGGPAWFGDMFVEELAGPASSQ